MLKACYTVYVTECYTPATLVVSLLRAYYIVDITLFMLPSVRNLLHFLCHCYEPVTLSMLLCVTTCYTVYVIVCYNLLHYVQLHVLPCCLSCLVSKPLL